MGLWIGFKDSGWEEVRKDTRYTPYENRGTIVLMDDNATFYSSYEKEIPGIAESKFIRRGDSAYVIEGPTWEEAEAFNANKLGGHLVTINDADENQWLVDTFKERNSYVNYEYRDQYWIGLDQKIDGEFFWSSGEEYSYEKLVYELSNDPHDLYGQLHGEIILSEIDQEWKSVAGSWNDEFYSSSAHGKFGIAEIKLAPNNAPTGQAQIIGEFRVGETLTADVSKIKRFDNFEGWTPTYNYLWKSSSDNQNWTEIGQGNNYKITTLERGKFIKLDVSYLDGYGTQETISSEISNNNPKIPYINDGSASFEIEGSATIGSLLKIKEVGSDPDGTGILSYSWQTSSDGNTWTEVGDNSTYSISEKEKGKSIKAVISYKDNEGFNEKNNIYQRNYTKNNGAASSQLKVKI